MIQLPTLYIGYLNMLAITSLITINKTKQPCCVDMSLVKYKLQLRFYPNK